jgi:hypothetical protein
MGSTRIPRKFNFFKHSEIYKHIIIPLEVFIYLLQISAINSIQFQIFFNAILSNQYHTLPLLEIFLKPEILLHMR